MAHGDLLTGREIEQLARRVAQHVTALADPGIVPPTASDYVVAAYRSGSARHTLTVDVDMGGFVLPLSASPPDTHQHGHADVERLANTIAGQIAHASHERSAIVTRLAAVRAAASASAARGGGKIVDVRIARSGLAFPFFVQRCSLDVDVELLDDALRSRIETLTARTPRLIHRMIASRRPAQRERLRRRKCLRSGELLRVNAITEAAIRHAGHSVGAVAAQLLDAEECDQWVELQTTRGSDVVSVRLLDGQLVAAVVASDLGYWDHREVRIYREFPESVCRALVGLDLHHVADHPIVRCAARICGVVSDDYTDITVTSPERAVTVEELRARTCAFAA